MDWQQTVSLLIVAATAGAFFRSWLRRRRFVWERDTHCGCSSPGQPGARRSVVYHTRNGQRPQIIVKSR